MDKDGDGGGEGGGGKSDASLLDAASLFGAYWGRDGAAGAAAAQQQQQAAAAAQLFGFPGGAGARGYPPSSSTLSVAASQAASLGLHPAASAAWWQMASHLAAQDYLARIQASGLNFPPLGDPYSALSALSGGSLGSLGSGGGKSSSKGSKGKVGERSGRNSSSSVGSSSSSKEKSPATGMGGSQNARSSYGFPKTSSPSMMHMSSPSQSSLAGMSLPPSLAGLNSLVSGGKSGGMPGPNNAGTSSKHGRKSSSKSSGSSGGGGSLKERELALLRGDLLLAQAAAQGAYQAAVVAATKGGKQNSSNPYGMNNPFGLSGSGSGLDKERHSGMDSIANLPHTILSAALEGGDPSSVLGGVRLPPDTEIIKYTSSISGPKVRKPSGGSSRGRKKTISLDPPHVSVLPSSGSSLPPKRLKLESEYGGSNLSSSGQPLSAHSGSGSRDRVEVIRLPSRNDASTAQSALEDYSGLSRELLQSIASQSGLSLAALERQLAGPNPTGFNLGGKSLSGHATSSPADSSQPLDLGKNSCVGVASAADEDAPLNLSLKPSANESTANSWDWSHVGGGGSDALSRLTSLSSSLSAPPPSSDRVSRRKPGAKPRRVIQESSLSPPPSHGLMMPTDDSPRPKSSGSEDSEMASSSLCAAGGGSSSSSREGRPRNLGRGVSKPKKNTVASLLAQSRALGLRPALAQQLLQEADLEKLKAVLGEASSFSEAQLSAAGAMSTDSEYVSDSDVCPSDSDASEVRDPLPASAKAGGRRRRGPGDDTTHLRVPLALGWKRDTVMKGLSRSGYIKGDVCYTPPEPHATARLRNVQELVSYLEKYPCPPLSQDNFSFSSRLLVGTFLQSAPPGLGLPTTNVDGVDYILMPEAEVAKRLEEARALTALGMGVGGASGGPRPLPPPPLDRRMELARQQQAARDAKRDATARGRQQARLVRELERSEKAEHAKREKEARNQQMMEIPIRRSQLSIQPLSQSSAAKQKSTVPEVSVWRTGEGNPKPVRSRTMAPISLTLIPVNSKDSHVKSLSPVRTINLDSSGWKNEIEQYNALDKMMSFAENAGFDYPKKTSSTSDMKYDFDLTIVKAETSGNIKTSKSIETNKPRFDPSSDEVALRITKSEVSLEEQNERKYMDLLTDSYTRIDEFVKGCDWTTDKIDEKSAKDARHLEKCYLEAKNKYMSKICHLKMSESAKKTILPDEMEKKINVVEIIDLSEEDEGVRKVENSGVQTYTLGKDGAISVSVHRRTRNLSPGRVDNLSAKRKRQEETEKLRMEEQTRKAQEREMKRQQAVMMKEQERERRRQHTALVRQLESRRRWEERERRKHQILMDRLLGKEKRMQERRHEMELLAELRRPQEDSTLSDQKPLPVLNRIPGLKLSGEAMADIMMVFEFIHNFGQTLGFDMETLPTLNTLQMALLPDCCPDAEEELLTVLQHLLVCAIEDPGIPHPGRHTTLLGQAIRLGDINTGNISEILRIYLYANATGEVKALTGISQEREREKRVADHHQTEEEMRATCNSGGRNVQYYEHLRANPTYRLAELLREKPFLALSSTAKARTLGHLCNELLQNRAVLRQIDASLEHLNQLRKERYLMEAKLRKLRGLHTRKQRAEATERQQTLALERMQRLVEESQGIDCKKGDVDGDTVMAPPIIKDNVSKQDNSCASLKDIDKPLVLDKDSITGDDSLMLSDAESEGTQPEEDEDKNLSSEELGRKLERLLKQSEQQLQSLTAGAHSLRATCYGQDRYWRRYWSLGKCGGIFVEGMESAQPEILPYHEALEAGERRKMDDEEKRKRDIDNVKRGRRSRARKGQKDKRLSSETPPEVARDVNVKTEDQIKSELELKSIKSELNLSDHTQIIKYEPNVRDGHCKVEGSPIKMEERYIQQQQNKQAEEMLDIEDSIPTAFLVQKPPLNKPLDLKGEMLDLKIELALESDPCELDLSNSVESEPQVNNLDELKKLADSVSQKDVISETNSQSDSMESKDGLAVKAEVSAAVKEEEKQQVDLEMATLMLYNKMLEGKWFSILRREHALVANGTNGLLQPSQPEGTQSVTSSPEKNDKQPGEGLNGVNGGPLAAPSFYERTTTCAQVVMCQGHKWEVSNNLHLLSNPALLVTNPSQAIAMPSAPGTYADSSLTLSGLQQDLLDASLHVKYEDDPMDTSETKDEECEDNAEEKVVQDTTAHNIKTEMKRERDSWYYSSASYSGSASLGYAALTAYVSCDSPPPLQLSVEEGELLELCKVRGLPPKVEGNFVAKELRHGWWRITDSDCLRELLECLHPRGVRERELQAALLSHPVLHSSIKLGTDLAATELSISNLDRVIALNGGYPGSDSMTAYSAKTARRLRQQVMQKVEALEEAVVAASIQMKGWRPTRATTSPVPQDDGSPLVVLARARLAELEANIERRYLNPPLGHSTGDANIGAVLQAESHGATPTQSPSTGSSNQSSECGSVESKGVPRGLAIWREAVARCQSAAQVAMVLQALKSAIAWDRSVMTANCQFCLSGDSEDKLLICDGCDKGYHTYCFKPKMDKIPDGDWYCWECVNKATGERACIVCGGASGGGSSSGRGRLVPCALCARAYHQECHVPPLGKVPRGKWYCVNCIAKAPPKKPRSTSRKKDPRHSKESTLDGSDHQMVPSPAPSHASTSTTADDSSSVNYPTHPPTPLPPLCANPPAAPAPAPETISRTEYDDSCLSVSDTNNHLVGANHIQDAMEVDQNENGVPEEHFQAEEPMVVEPENGSTGNGTPEIQQEQDTSEDQEHPKRTEQGSCEEAVTEDTALVVENNTMSGRQKKEKSAAKRLQKDLNMCKSLLEQMEMHQDSWPFLLPVNTKQFPTYKKVIRSPMDLSTIKRKLHDSSYKCKEEFCADVRQIFHNCEVFNEDESPVGRAGHNMRTYFEERWAL